MKADELMVGDIVLRKGKPVEIVSTSGIEYSFGQQDITIYQGKGNGLESHTMRGIAPMRMTEKLLMALGFASSVSPNEWVYEDSEKRIDICVDHTELDHWWVCVRHGHSKQTDNFQYFEGFADYLHLFQHILRRCVMSYDFHILTSDLIPQTSAIEKVKPFKSDKKWQKLSAMPTGTMTDRQNSTVTCGNTDGFIITNKTSRNYDI